MTNYVVKQGKILGIESFDREGADVSTFGVKAQLEHIVRFVYMPTKSFMAAAHILDTDKKKEINGDLTIYKYDKLQNEVSCLTHNKFINQYIDGDIKYGEELLEWLRVRINNINRELLGNEQLYTFESEGEMKMFFVKDREMSCFLIFALNGTKEKITKYLLKSILCPYIKIEKVEDSETRFAIYATNASAPFCSIRYIKKMQPEDCQDICKQFIEQLKLHKQKVNNPKAIKYALSIYKDYSDFVDGYIYRVDDLKKRALRYTFGGTKLRKYEFRDAEDQKEYDAIRDEALKLWELLSHTNNSKAMRFIRLMEDLRKKTEDMKKWSPTTHWKGNTCRIDCPYSSIEDYGPIKGEQHTLDLRFSPKEAVKPFIEENRHGEFYITYIDDFGNTYVEKARLFIGSTFGTLCEFKKGSSKSGYPIDRKWVRIDYFTKKV